MILQVNQFHLLVVISYLALKLVYCQLVQQILQQSVNYVYKAFPDEELQIDYPNQQFNQIIYKEKVKLVYIQNNDGQVIVLDAGQKNKQINVFQMESCISGIIVSSDGLKIICYSKQKFSSYSISEIRKQQIEQLYTENMASNLQIIQVQIDQKEKYLFLATIDGVISVYDMVNFKSFVKVNQFTHKSASFVGFKVSNNMNYIIIEQSYQGLAVLKLKQNMNIKEKVEIKLAGTFVSQTSYSSYIFSDESALLTLDYWGGVQIGLLDQISQADESQYPLKLVYLLEQWWKFDDPMPYCLTVNEEKRLLYVGGRSQGIFIIDIQDFTKPVMIQNIALNSYAMSIQVSNDIQYIYYTNRAEFFIFSLTIPYFQNNYSHFFNSHQSNLTEIQQTKWIWRCFIDQQDKYLYSASDIYGLQIYNIEDGPNELKQVFSLHENNEFYLQIDDMIFLQNESYILVPYGLKTQSSIFRVYDVRDLENIFIVTEVVYNSFNTVSGMRKSSDERYIVSTYEQSILILDCFDFLLENESNPNKQINVVKEYKFSEVNKDITSDVTFLLNNQYIIACFSYFGYSIVQFTSSTERGGEVALDLLFTFQTYGGESICISSNDPKIGFIADGLNGILIVSFEQLPEKVLEKSRLPMSGWVNYILLINNESQLVATSIDKGYITVVDILNIEKPFIVTEFIFREKYNFSSCMSIKKGYFFFNTEKGLRGLTIKQQSLVHTDIAEIFQNKITNLQTSDILKIGQTVVMKLSLIYPQNGQQIKQVYYYKNREKLPLPSDWMQFDQSSQQLQIKVSKDGLNSQKNQISQNIVVVLSIFKLSAQSFIYNNTQIDNIDSKYVTTTPAQSAMIFDYLQKKGYIDWKTSIVNPDLMQDNVVYFEIDGVQSSDRLFKAVTHTLQQSYTYNPIYFNIQSSLNFNLNSENNIFVSSLSPFISITLSFYSYVDNNVEEEEGEQLFSDLSGIPGGAIFLSQMKTLTSGLSITISKEETIIKIEGSQIKINEFLQAKIVYWYQNPTEDQKLQQNMVTPTNILVSILVQDLINYDVKSIQPLGDVPFLKLKGPIKQKGEDNIIQKQFNKEYSEGIVYINQVIDIQFERESFFDSDNLDVQYSVMFADEEDIPPDYWLQFQPSSMRLYGAVPQSIFGEVVVIRVVAQNNYTIYWNELKIYAYGVPFLYVLELLAKIVSPVLFLLGLYRFKYVLYNTFLRHKNRYSDEICYINVPYRKKIPLIGQDFQIAKCLVEGLKQLAQNQQSEIRKRNRINSRKRTTKTNKSSPFLTAPDVQNTFILNLSSNTQPKEINSPPYSSSRGFLKNQKIPLTMVHNRRGSLFREEYMKSNTPQKRIYVNKLIQQQSDNLHDKDQNLLSVDIPQNASREKLKKNLRIEVNFQAKSLPNIPDEEIANQSNEYAQNLSINEQVHNQSSFRQDLNHRRHSSLAASEIHISSKSNNLKDQQESSKITVRQVNFSDNYEKDKFFGNDCITHTNNQILYTDTPKSALKITPGSFTNRSAHSNYQTPSRSHFNPSRTQFTQDLNLQVNKIDRRGTLDKNDNQENFKNEQLHHSKNSNNQVVNITQINEEQEEKESNEIKEESISESVRNQNANKISFNKSFLTPHTDNSQNWGQEMGKSPLSIKRQMSISPMGEEFKRQMNSLKNIQKKKQKSNKQRTVFEVKYMEENGNINMENVISDIIQQNTNFMFQMRKCHASDFILELKNKDSILYNYIKSLIARYLLSLDRQSTLVYNILKQYALQNFSYTSNDWYKVYVDIQAKQESDIHGFQISFPRLSINSTQMQRAIRSLFLFEPNNFEEQSQNDDELNPTIQKPCIVSQVSQNHIYSSHSQINFPSKHTIHGFNQNLIEEIFMADALGLTNKEPSKRFPGVGESLHLRGYQVDSVEAFSIQKRDNTFCSKLREAFGLNYHRYGSSQNIKLPSWINFYQKQNLIFLEGTPSSHDIEEILIRIYNYQRYIIKEFVLKITNEYNFLAAFTEKQDEIIQENNMNQSRRVSGEDRPNQQHSDTNRSPKLTSTSNYSNYFLHTPNQNQNQFNQNQFKSVKSITNLHNQNNEPLSSPTSLSQISITSHNKLQLFSEEQEKFSLDYNFHRIPQTSDNHRFISDINPMSGYNIPQFIGIKRLNDTKDKSKSNSQN